MPFVPLVDGGVGLVSDKSLEDAFAESRLRTASRRLTRPLEVADAFDVVADGPLLSDKSRLVEFAASRRLAAVAGLMRGDADDLLALAAPFAIAGGELPSDRSVAVEAEPRRVNAARNLWRVLDAGAAAALAAAVEGGPALAWPQAAPLHANTTTATEIASLFDMESPVRRRRSGAFTSCP